MVAVVFYKLEFDVDHDSDSAHIYAGVQVTGLYAFDGKDKARERLPEIKEWHPGDRWTAVDVKQPDVERAERDKYQMRMCGDWS